MAPLLANQQYLQQEKLGPAELAQKVAGARYTSALADKVEMDVAADRKAAALMTAQMAGNGQSGSIGGAQPSSLSGLLYSQAQIWAAAGKPEMAARLTAQASQAASHEATARAADVRAKLSQFSLQKQQIGMMSNLLGGVKDEESWQAANSAFEKETGQASPFKDTPYDPKLVETLQDSLMTAYQKAVLDTKVKALGITASNVASEIQHRATQDAIAAERLRVSQARELRMQKAGGKDVGFPSKGEIDAAARLIGSDLEGDDLDNAATAVAAKARELRKKNPGLNGDDAMRQALQQVRNAGEIQPGKRGGLFGIGSEKGSFSVPQPLPASGKASDLVKGQIYKGPKGNFRWTGKGWEAVGAAPAKAASDGSDEEDDDDSDE